jgi:DNA-directed RNA polymerase specialized sigma24 family protein
MMSDRLMALRARRTLERDYEQLRLTTIRAVERKLAGAGTRVDRVDLDAHYNLAWHALFEKLSGGEAVENPGGFLVQVAYFRAVDEFRKQHVDRRIDVQDIVDVPAAEVDAAARIDDADQLRAFMQGLRGRLSDRELRAASLCYLHGYTRPEAAAVMGLPVSRMVKLMDCVSKAVNDLVAELKAGRWCDEQHSLMTAYALGILDLDGQRYGLALAHLADCPSCRGYVRKLRGIGGIVPPIVLPWSALGLGFGDIVGSITGGGAATPAPTSSPCSTPATHAGLAVSGVAAATVLAAVAIAGTAERPTGERDATPSSTPATSLAAAGPGTTPRAAARMTAARMAPARTAAARSALSVAFVTPDGTDREDATAPMGTAGAADRPLLSAPAHGGGPSAGPSWPRTKLMLRARPGSVEALEVPRAKPEPRAPDQPPAPAAPGPPAAPVDADEVEPPAAPPTPPVPDTPVQPPAPAPAPAPPPPPPPAADAPADEPDVPDDPDHPIDPAPPVELDDDTGDGSSGAPWWWPRDTTPDTPAPRDSPRREVDR